MPGVIIMLKINDIEYKSIKKAIKFLPFEAIVDGDERKGKALNITLETNNFKLSIETVYDLQWINELKVNARNDISKYIIGLPYEDKKGWIYFSDKCKCTINRINNNTFDFSLSGNFEECDEVLNIEYDDIFEI